MKKPKLTVYCGLNGIEMIVNNQNSTVVYLEKTYKTKKAKKK